MTSWHSAIIECASFQQEMAYETTQRQIGGEYWVFLLWN